MEGEDAAADVAITDLWRQEPIYTLVYIGRIQDLSLVIECLIETTYDNLNLPTLDIVYGKVYVHYNIHTVLTHLSPEATGIIKKTAQIQKKRRISRQLENSLYTKKNSDSDPGGSVFKLPPESGYIGIRYTDPDPASETEL